MSIPPLDTTNTSTEDAYNQLITILHPSPPSILEIDILPSTFPPQILSDHPSLALSKPLLAALSLLARRTFFNHHLHSHHDAKSHATLLKATTILLLLDPNHLTAANFRKKHIQQNTTTSPTPPQPQAPNPTTSHPLSQALTSELHFLTTLLTSPLPKHPKSSTLWSHRLWLYQHHPAAMVGTEATESQTSKQVWNRELAIVMKAGERHPRNYYAWNYARGLFCIVQSFASRAAGEWEGVLVDTSRGVHGWCLMHPRDISGWAFLVFWLGKMREQVLQLRSREGEVEGEVGRVVAETREWLRKYAWNGESVEWFLKAVNELGLEGQ